MSKIRSMTGFASLRKTIPGGELACDIKSVNGRYFEAFFKLPDNLRHLEVTLRDRLKDSAPRGKFDVSLTYTPSQGSAGTLNKDFARSMCDNVQRLKELCPEGIIQLTHLLLLPGMLTSDEKTSEQTESAILSSFDELCAQLAANREREGARLKAAIEEKLTALEAQLEPVHEQLQTLVQKERDKLKERLANLQLKAEFDQDRLEQEVALLAQRADIAEEYDRLCSHISEVRDILQRGGSCGKRLDFMMQEFNREANTMASKASNLSITKIAVELKVLIEQMREQVQNIE